MRKGITDDSYNEFKFSEFDLNGQIVGELYYDIV